MKRLILSWSSLVLLACGSSTTSSPGAPTISTPPANATVSAGQTATFNVTAAGSGTLTYQWQRNDTSIPGETQASTTTAPTSATDNGATYRVIVTNASGSVTSAEATLTVTPPIGPQTLTLHTVGRSGGNSHPSLVGFQDGDGAWQTATPNAGGDYTFTVSADRYGIAVTDLTDGGGPSEGYIYQGTVSEMPVLNLPLAAAPTTSSRTPVTAHIQGLAADAGGANLYGCGVGTAAAPDVTCMLAPGNFDAFAQDGQAYVLKRGQTVFAAPTDLGGFDFGSGQTRLVSNTLTVSGLPPNNPNPVTGGGGLQFQITDRYQLIGTLYLPFGTKFPSDANGNSQIPINQLPSSALEPSDVQYVLVHTGAAAAPPTDQFAATMEVLQYYNATGDLTVPRPENFVVKAYSLATTTPYPRVQFDWTPVSSLPLYILTVGGAPTWYCHITRGWLQNATQATYVFPDLSGVAGWSSTFALTSGDETVVMGEGVSSVDLGVVYSPTQYSQPKLFLPPFVADAGTTVTRVFKAGVDLTIP